MVDTIRQRATMEMLDVWKNVNRQVFNREKKQVSVFPETVLPKTQRDIGTEVNVDKSIEQLNRLIESRLAPLEALLLSFNPTAKTFGTKDFDSNFQLAVNTGDIIPLWNQIVRYYQQQGLSRQSQELVKVSLQQLKPNLDAINYGLRSGIDKALSSSSFQAPSVSKPVNLSSKVALTAMEFLRADSVYKAINQQIASGGFSVLDNQSLNSQYKNNFQSLSHDELAFLKAHAPRDALIPSTIRNIPDFDANDATSRLKAIQEELGVVFPPELIGDLRRLPLSKLSEALDKLSQDAKQELGVVSENYTEEKNRFILLSENIEFKKESLERRANVFQLIEQEIKALKSGVEEKIEPLLPVPPIPTRVKPIIALGPNATQAEIDAHDIAFNQRKEAIDRRNELIRERDRIISHNEKVDNATRSKDEKDDLIRQKEEDLNDLQREWAEISAELEEDYNVLAKLKNTPAFSGELARLLGNIPARPTSKSIQEFIRNHPIEGYGKPKERVDTRGLASMRENYGKPEESESEDSSSESEPEFMDFDDSRNEHYTHRPVKYY